MVFDGVVRATIQDLGDLCPAVAHFPVHHEKDPFLLLRPYAFLYLRIQMVVPAFAALFSESSRKVVADHCPLLGTDLLN